MTTAFQLVSVLIGVGLWVLLIIKAAVLVPFSRQTMADRQERIEQALGGAVRAQDTLMHVQRQIEDRLAQARAQQDEILRRAHVEAVAVADEISRRGRADAAAMVERARTDIAIERDRTMQELRTLTAELVMRAAGSAISNALDAGAQQQLIDRSLQSVSRMSHA